MKYVMEHYGNALVAAAVLLAIGALLVGLLANGGTISQQFTNALSSFFNSMQAVTGAGTP